MTTTSEIAWHQYTTGLPSAVITRERLTDRFTAHIRQWHAADHLVVQHVAGGF